MSDCAAVGSEDKMSEKVDKEESVKKEEEKEEEKKEGCEECEEKEEEDYIDEEKEAAKPSRFARSAALELTAACNHRCIFCSNVWKGVKGIKRPYEHAELTTEQWIRTVDILTELGVKDFMITGGEPTLHKGFKDIVKHCISKKCSVDIITNGEFVFIT